MPEYEEIEDTVEVPPGAGIDGYLKIIEGILKLSRVQEIIIKTGTVYYRRYAPPGDSEKELRIDLNGLMPYHVIRNSELEEIQALDNNAAIVVSQLFSAASRDGLNPIVFVSGPKTIFWDWHGKTTHVILGRGEAYGTPLLGDPDIPNDVLILCAAFSRDAKLVDTRKAYKVTIPMLERNTR